MEEHEQEERELVSGMERALATAVATGASVLESYLRRQALKQPKGQAAQYNGSTNEVPEVKEQIDLQHEVRSELAVHRDDSDVWRSAPYDVLNDQVMREHGIDPRKVGEPSADREWIRRSSGSEILDVYDSAHRWAGRSEAAHQVRDNIAAELSSYGLDLNELLHQPRGTAAEQIETARAQYWAQRGYDPEGTPAEQLEARNDGEHVEQLVEQGASSDRNARDSDARADQATAQGDAMSAAGVDDTPTRSVQAADHSGTSAAGKAAAVAARDHPTDPRSAASSAPKKGPKVKPRPAQKQRGHTHGR